MDGYTQNLRNNSMRIDRIILLLLEKLRLKLIASLDFYGIYSYIFS